MIKTIHYFGEGAFVSLPFVGHGLWARDGADEGEVTSKVCAGGAADDNETTLFVTYEYGAAEAIVARICTRIRAAMLARTVEHLIVDVVEEAAHALAEAARDKAAAAL